MVGRIAGHVVLVLAALGLLKPIEVKTSRAAVANREAAVVGGERDDNYRPPQAVGRRATVADMIQMTRVAGSSYARSSYGGSLSSDFAFFSPNRKRFAVVLKKGNLRRNTNDYSLFVFEIGGGLRRVRCKRLVSFSSSSNREAINQVTWLEDNDTILFLGERPGERTQLYSVACRSGHLAKLSHHPTNLISYSSTPLGDLIVYAAEEPVTSFGLGGTRGLRVSNQSLSDLVSGHFRSLKSSLYLLRVGDTAAMHLHTRGDIIDDPVELFVSPNGRHLIVRTNVADPPRSWIGYKDATIQRLVRRDLSEGESSWLFRYELVDLAAGSSRWLLDAPIGSFGSEVAWETDSRAVVVTGVYLPLDVGDSAEVSKRESHTFVAEANVLDLEVTEISDQGVRLANWDPKHSFLKLSKRIPQAARNDEAHCYRKDGGHWKRVDCGIDAQQPEISVVQNVNSPPRIAATDPSTGRKTILLDLNPQFRGISFGKVEKVEWRGGNRSEVEGGLYLPPDYVAGRRYPLVIQTHGFDPDQFWIAGPFATAFAAQALAGKEFVVLQVPDSHYSMDTPEEAAEMAATYENAIDVLDRKGIIDSKRVGIVGFSRTGLYVRYMLTHGRHHFAAAVIADGFDDGFWTYFAYANESAYFASELQELIGASPFGEGLNTWLNRSSGFLLEKVNTPVQIQVNDNGSLLGNWDWFVGLKRLHKPVELLYFPNGTHILEKPSEQLASKQAVVDWFCFWLKGEGDLRSLAHEPDILRRRPLQTYGVYSTAR
jgi:dipeptidyl aminopeptidase/acylaminoacyl peptidase